MKIMIKFIRLRQKIHSYLKYNGSGDKKRQKVQKSVIKQELQFEDYKKSLRYKVKMLKQQQRFKFEAHNVFTDCTKQ